MKKLLFVLACLTGLSCGKAQLEFVSPGEGQTYSIEQLTGGSIDFNVSNNEFDGVNIEFRGFEAVSTDIRCDNTQNSPVARCYRTSIQQFSTGGFNQGCNPSNPCSVVALLIKDGQIHSTRTIRFTRGQAQQQQQQGK